MRDGGTLTLSAASGGVLAIALLAIGGATRSLPVMAAGAMISVLAASLKCLVKTR